MRNLGRATNRDREGLRPNTLTDLEFAFDLNNIPKLSYRSCRQKSKRMMNNNLRYGKCFVGQVSIDATVVECVFVAC